ncbi:MAG: polyprenyl synthetase family protein [Myxococcales bacterium]|nr:polyprenyl synthetase family protein [Myxococcales bacterium]MCB9753492.1 polyprenyl synthetase family protein [Myxococcales bacterium]
MSESALDPRPAGLDHHRASSSPREPHARLLGRPDVPVLATAFELVRDGLAVVESTLAEFLQSTIRVIPQLGGHLVFAGGKRLRPMITLLAARAVGEREDERSCLAHAHTVAAVGELLHTATLLHDDVIDGGAFRRGRPAAHHEFGNGMTVLTGDYCLARAVQAIASTGELAAIRSFADMVTRMAEGEVDQLCVAGDCEVDEARYYLVIERKTAGLIAWCTSIAGLPSPALSRALECFGRELGFAFQISDDVLDYTGELAVAGKLAGQDLREGKLTLPLLMAIEREPALRHEVRELLSQGPPVDEAALARVVTRVIALGGVERATARAQHHVERALAHLMTLAPSPARDALEHVSRRVAQRAR